MTPTRSQPVFYDPLTLPLDPYPVYAALRDEAPVFHNAERDVWALSRFAELPAVCDWQAARAREQFAAWQREPPARLDGAAHL